MQEEFIRNELFVEFIVNWPVPRIFIRNYEKKLLLYFGAAAFIASMR